MLLIVDWHRTQAERERLRVGKRKAEVPLLMGAALRDHMGWTMMAAQHYPDWAAAGSQEVDASLKSVFVTTWHEDHV